MAWLFLWFAFPAWCVTDAIDWALKTITDLFNRSCQNEVM